MSRYRIRIENPVGYSAPVDAVDADTVYEALLRFAAKNAGPREEIPHDYRLVLEIKRDEGCWRKIGEIERGPGGWYA